MFDLDRLMLGFVLFTIIFCFECWLFTPASTADVPTQTSTEEVQQLPIEKQMQEIFDVIDEQKTQQHQSVEAIEQLTLRQARKVAKELGITQTRTQKIDGEMVKKDKPKDWLIREIKQRIIKDRQLINTVTGILEAA